MREIPLNRGLVALVDDEDYADLIQFKWRVHRRPGDKTWYAVRTTSRQELRPRTMEKMHRRILGAKAGQLVDHRDGDGLRNTRDNIRLCTIAENNRNVSKPKHGDTSPFKGVSWNKNACKWTAVVRHQYRNVYLGLFANPVSAGHAYDRKSRELFGDFARPNFAPLPDVWRGK